MGAATALPERDLHVDPGAKKTVTVLVRNTGDLVDQFTIDVVGDCARWTQVEPKVINLLPGADADVTVTFTPARSSEVRAGSSAFGVRVLSREDPPGSAVVEGTVDVAEFDELAIELVPRQSRGRRRGRHQLAIDNNGNRPCGVAVSGYDEEEALNFRFHHAAAVIEPGAAAFIRVSAMPEKRFLKGADKQLPFIVTVVPDNAPPIATRGTMTQRQLLPNWLLPAAAACLALALAAIILWETVLKPTIRSEVKDAAFQAARQAVKAQTTELASKASAAQSQAAAAGAAAEQANAAAAAAKSAAASLSSAGTAGGNTGPSAASGASAPGGANIDKGTAISYSVQASAVPTTDRTQFTLYPGKSIPANKILVVTYLVFQNPHGDQGTLKVLRGATEALLTEGLANFRDLDHPFQVEPLLFSDTEPLNVAVNCEKSTGTVCDPAVLVTGRLVDKKPVA